MKTEFFQLASTLTKIKISAEEKAQLRLSLEAIHQDSEKQQAFFDYCKQWKLAPWVYAQLVKHGFVSYLEDTVADQFQEQYEAVKTSNKNRSKEAARFLKRFAEQDIAVAILKGNLFVHTIYNDPGYKRMNDFDMLIPIKDWPSVQAIYFELGYIPLGFGWSGEKQEVAKFSHVGMSFISPNYHCITGTQWGLKSPTSNYNKEIVTQIWDTVEDFSFEGVPVKKLSSEYNLLHLILHMGVYKCGIRDCMDVYNLMAAEPIAIDRFLTITKEANAIDKAYFTLALTNYCSGDIDPALLKTLEQQSGGFVKRRVKERLRMADRTGDMQLSYNDHFHSVEMVVFYFNLYTQFHQKLPIYIKILVMMLWPKMDAALKFCDLSDRPTFWNKLKARLKGPYFTFLLIGEEIGVGITIALFLKLFVDLILSLRNYFSKQVNYFDYLKSRNIDPLDIIAAVKKIQ